MRVVDSIARLRSCYYCYIMAVVTSYYLEMRGYISLFRRRPRTKATMVIMAAILSVSSILLFISEMQVVSSLLLNCCSSRRCVPTHYGTTARKQLFQSKRSNIDNGGDSGSSNNDYFDHLVSQFQGDFDNYNQVICDRNHGLVPAEGGGHEHIHCVLCPAPPSLTTADNGRQQQQRTQQKEQWVLAAFYFNGNPKAIFRFRMYKLISLQLNDDDGDRVRMKLHTLMPELEQQLRQYSDQPCTWWRETYQVWLNNHTSNNIEGVNNDEKFQSEGIDQLVSPLVGCDVLWDPKWDPEKHTYLYVDEYDDKDDIIVSSLPSDAASTTTTTRSTNDQKDNDDDEGLHATMEAGSKGAIVDSISLIPGKRILIKDELSLWKDEFWINDRGYDPDAIIDTGNGEGDDEEYDIESNDARSSSRMPFVYGNRRGIPYKLERVSSITSAIEETRKEDTLLLQRKISNQELAWTMGEDYREQAVYEEKLHAVEEALVLSEPNSKL